jgi:competence ComEA-like helix-hairpin-helix protein
MSKGIKILSESRALIAPLNDVQNDKAAEILNKAVADVASVDGDRVLDQFEAQALNDVWSQVVPQGQGPITEAQATRISSALSLQINQMKSSRVDSTEAIFTSEGKALQRFRASIMGAMQDTIDKANGRPVDVNMMLFAFTDPEMADGILDMARDNPNVNFRLMTDWTQLPNSGNRQPRRIMETAKAEGLDNIQVKFKKDNPYVWDDNRKRPRYHHSKTQGLNHHKGFVTLIDGRPEKMAFGSFNWSLGAMKRNYENLMLLDRADNDNRAIMGEYQGEFEAFWNNDDVALTLGEALNEKNRLQKELYEANGETYLWDRTYEVEDDPEYKAVNTSPFFDINSFADKDVERLEGMIGKTRTREVMKELRDFGRFDSWTELLVRVPSLAELPTWEREPLMEHLEYGEGGLSVNTASVEELDRAGLSRRQAERVVALREEQGSLESLDEITGIRGIGARTLDRVDDSLHVEENQGYYSARKPGEAPTTGWADSTRGTGTETVVKRPEGPFSTSDVRETEEVANDLAAPVKSLLRRAQPGQTFRMAMYGLSTSSPEYAELKAAIERGVSVRVVLYGKYNDKAANALEGLKAQGHDVDYRIIKSRVMHEKFGVVGDDLFNGSSNWSTSSMTKHTEDRFLFRNQPALAHRFVEEFSRLWERARP